MDKSNYNQLINAQETQRKNAWNFVFSAWHTTEWKPLPQNIKSILGFSSSLGVCSGMLITETAANGIKEFVNKMNNRK